MKEREIYIAPTCREIRIRLEGCIAASGNEDFTPDYSGFNEEEVW